MESIVSAIITGIVGIVCVIIEANSKKDRARAEERAKIRAEESKLSMQMMDATLQLSIVTANAFTGGHNNGNVAQAKAAAEEARKEYVRFMADTAIRQFTK